MSVASCRWLSTRLFRKHRNSLLNIYNFRRTFLSQTYYCQEQWEKRLQSGVLSQVDIEEFSVSLQDKFEKHGMVNAVDIDVLVNKLSKIPKRQLDFTQTLLYRFRHTNECLKSPPSTHHAVIRELLELQDYDRLWEILKNKINYGIFLDDFSANILLDHFLKKKLYQEAAYVAFDQMWQENFSHPICKALSWYACHQLWQTMEISSPTTQEVVEEEEEREADSDEEEEEVKVIKVNYIENPWYDDHFDISKESMLLGKTFTMLMRAVPNLAGRSYMLIGWGLYEKFDRGLELMKKWAESDEKLAVCQEALSDFQQRLSTLETKETPPVKDPGSIALEDLYPYVTDEQKTLYLQQFEELQDKLQSAEKVVEEYDLESDILTTIKEALSNNEETDITKQSEMYDSWITNRQNMIKDQIAAIKRAAKQEEIVRRLEELRQRELKLTFFDHKRRIKLLKKRGSKVKELEELFETEEMVHWHPRT